MKTIRKISLWFIVAFFGLILYGTPIARAIDGEWLSAVMHGLLAAACTVLFFDPNK